MNATSEYDFTVIVPVFNENEGIPELGRRLAEFIPLCSEKACVLFVNDGSTDGSDLSLKKLCEQNKDFFFIGFEKNAGLSAAIKAGIDATFSRHCGYMDADLQTAPEDFNLLLKHIGEYPLVTGVRAERNDSAFRRFQSRFANSFRRMLTRDGATDTCCPLKVLQTDAAKRIPFFDGMHRFLPALILLQEGGCYKEVPVRHFPRVAGTSKFNLANRVFRSFSDCFGYRWMKRRYLHYHIAETEF